MTMARWSSGLLLAALVALAACAVPNVHVEGGSESKTRWNLSLPL